MKEFLDKNNWEDSLNTKWIGKNLKCYDELVSTNVTAAALGNEGAAHGTLVTVDKQTGGRGRRGRTWESPGGKNLYFSLLLRPKFAPEKASMLTLVMAVSVAKSIEQTAVTGGSACSVHVTGGACATCEVCSACEAAGQVGIKWPNDILIHGKKVCGILTEMKVEQGRIGHVIVGVGINVKPQNFDGELADKASTLEQEWGLEIDRAELLKNIMQTFEEDYEAFLMEGNLKPFMDYYHSMLLNKDMQVKVLDPQEPFEGIARGITEIGELIVERDDGRIVEVYAGEVSVRGLLGYV